MISPFDVYLAALWIQGPARIQEIRGAAKRLFGEFGERLVVSGALTSTHGVLRGTELVIQVKRGVYVISPEGRAELRAKISPRALTNRRLFLMKSERRRYMKERGGARAM